MSVVLEVVVVLTGVVPEVATSQGVERELAGD